MLRRWRNRRQERVRLEELATALADFAWVWADVANTDSYSYGASLACSEAGTLARLLYLAGFENTATDLVREHRDVCHELTCAQPPAEEPKRRAWEPEPETAAHG